MANLHLYILRGQHLSIYGGSHQNCQQAGSNLVEKDPTKIREGGGLNYGTARTLI
jgi:hypothetical protein